MALAHFSTPTLKMNDVIPSHNAIHSFQDHHTESHDLFSKSVRLIDSYVKIREVYDWMHEKSIHTNHSQSLDLSDVTAEGRVEDSLNEEALRDAVKSILQFSTRALANSTFTTVGAVLVSLLIGLLLWVSILQYLGIPRNFRRQSFIAEREILDNIAQQVINDLARHEEKFNRPNSRDDSLHQKPEVIPYPVPLRALPIKSTYETVAPVLRDRIGLVKAKVLYPPDHDLPLNDRQARNTPKRKQEVFRPSSVDDVFHDKMYSWKDSKKHTKDVQASEIFTKNKPNKSKKNPIIILEPSLISTRRKNSKMGPTKMTKVRKQLHKDRKRGGTLIKVVRDKGEFVPDWSINSDLSFLEKDMSYEDELYSSKRPIPVTLIRSEEKYNVPDRWNNKPSSNTGLKQLSRSVKKIEKFRRLRDHKKSATKYEKFLDPVREYVNPTGGNGKTQSWENLLYREYEPYLKKIIKNNSNLKSMETERRVRNKEDNVNLSSKEEFHLNHKYTEPNYADNGFNLRHKHSKSNEVHDSKPHGISKELLTELFPDFMAKIRRTKKLLKAQLK